MATTQTAANDNTKKLPLRVTFRKAAQKDIENLARVFAHAFGEFNEFGNAEKYIDNARHDRDHRLIVAGADGKTAGFVMTTSRSFRPNSIYIEQIAVAPEMQGKGVGRGLLKQTEALARKQGFNAVALRVRKGNEKAIGLYASMGFEMAGVEWRYFQDGTTAYRMVKDLRATPANDDIGFGRFFKKLQGHLPRL